MPAIRTPLLVASLLTMTLVAAAFFLLAARPTLAAHPEEGEGDLLPDAADEPHDAVADHGVPVEPYDAPAVRDYSGAIPGLALRERDGAVSRTERRRWGLDEERARCLLEMRARYGWGPRHDELLANRFRSRLDPRTRLPRYEWREADGPWRRIWPEEGRIASGFHPRPDESRAARDALRGHDYPGLAEHPLGPPGRYRSGSPIPGLRLDGEHGFPPAPDLLPLAPFEYDGPWPWERDGESRGAPAEAAPGEADREEAETTDEAETEQMHAPPAPEDALPPAEARLRPDLAA